METRALVRVEVRGGERLVWVTLSKPDLDLVEVARRDEAAGG